MRKSVVFLGISSMFVSTWVMAAPAQPMVPFFVVSLPVKSVSDLFERAREIRFEPKTSRLHATSHSYLDTLANQLIIESTVGLEIGVHVATSGNSKRDLEFSKTRAEVIKGALVARGVAEERLETKGYGAEQPIAPSVTRTGRNRNERVEIHRLAH